MHRVTPSKDRSPLRQWARYLSIPKNPEAFALPYDTNRYGYEQLADEVMIGEIKYLPKETNRFFAIGLKFIEHYMSFSDTIIIQMGCWGVSAGNDMANSFVDKGAKLYIA
jgi:hypothetical protein